MYYETMNQTTVIKPKKSTPFKSRVSLISASIIAKNQVKINPSKSLLQLQTYIKEWTQASNKP